MTHTLVIGYGNPLRGDDGAGWQVAQALSAHAIPQQVCITAHQLLPEMAQAVAMAQALVLVDACIGTPPGQIIHQPILPEEGTSLANGHYLLPQGLLLLAQVLYGHAPQTTLISITATSFDHGDRLSVAVCRAVEEVVGWFLCQPTR